MLDSIEALIIIVNEQGQILFFNNACANAFGYNYHEVRSHYFWEITSPTEPLDNLFPLNQNLNYPVNFENYVATKNNGRRLISWNCNLIREVKGELNWVVFRGIDITQSDITPLWLEFDSAFKHIAETIAANDSTDSILATMSRIVGETLKVDRSLIYYVDIKHHQITRLCGWLNPTIPNIADLSSSFSLDLFNTTKKFLWNSREWVQSHQDDFAPYLAEDGLVKLFHHEMGIQSLLWYPFLYNNDEGFYLLIVNQVSYRRTWREQEIEFL